MSTRTHCCLHVRGALFNRHFRGFTHDDGRPMTEYEAFDALCDEIAKGRRVIPMGECDNFDYQKGCQGHPSREPEPA